MRVLTCDCRLATRLLHTRYSDAHHIIAAKPSAGEAYARALAKLAESEEVDLLLPVSSTEMRVLLRWRQLFGQRLSYLGSLESFARIDDKLKLYELLGELGIPYPKVYDSIAEVTLPAVVKPSIGSAAKGVLYLRTDDDKAAAIATLGDAHGCVVQDYIAGIGAGYSVFAKDGHALVGYGHRRLCEYPVSGGASVYREGYEDSRLRNIAERILEASGWSGFAMFEFKITTSGAIYCLEANPRVWGSINQGLANGVDFFEPMVGRSTRPAARAKVRTYLSPPVYISLVRYLFMGRWHEVLDFVASLDVNAADVSFWRDPLGFLSFCLRAR
jgi:predicted ATP-grasp superfamily ATP-dependent carboligase